MDLDKHSPSKTKLSGTLSKVFRVGVPLDDGTKETKTCEKTEPDVLKKSQDPPFEDEDEELQRNEEFFAQLFACLSTVKAAYAQLQFAESPYDADGIQSADQTIVTELKNMSKMKQCYLKKEANDATPPETALLLAEIQEQKSLMKIYDITGKKLESQLKRKDAGIASLKEKLAIAERDNKSLEKKLNASGQLVELDNIRFSDLRPSHFIAYFRQTHKSIRSFVHLLIRKMESVGWNLDDAACSIEPGVSFWKPNHKCYVFESYVCKKMFNGFNNPNFAESTLDREELHCQFFELKSARPTDYLAQNPRSPFATFCHAKYSELMHPKMEVSLFGKEGIGDSIDFPDTPFFSAFIEMVKRVWLLHCLAMSFEPTVSIFRASQGSRFSEVYMESLSDEAFLACDGGTGPEANPKVAFTVVPGFRIGATMVQCQVYLCCF